MIRRPAHWLWLVLLGSPAAYAGLCAGFDPTLGMVRFYAWQSRPEAVLAVINKARAAGRVCPSSADEVELARIEAALRLGLGHEARRALAALQVREIPARGRVALLMADLAYLDGRMDEVRAWLDRAGNRARELDAGRADFLRAEVARTGGRFGDALGLAQGLPDSLSAYVCFNVAADALASGDSELAARVARGLLARPAYSDETLDLRQRARLVYARALSASSDASGAALVLDGVAAGGMYAQLALAERLRIALAEGDAATVDRLSGHLPGGEGDLARGYLLETSGAMGPARARYLRALDAFEARVRTLEDVKQRSREVAEALLRDPMALVGEPAAVAQFMAGAETMRLLVAARGLDERLARLDAAAESVAVLSRVAAEQDRRALANAARAERLGLGSRLDVLSAKLSASDPHAQTDPWTFASAPEIERRDELNAVAERAHALGRRDLEARAARLLGRLVWDLEWQFFDRRHAAVERHGYLSRRLAELRRRLRAVEAVAGEARGGGIQGPRFAALNAAIGAARERAGRSRRQAVDGLAVALERWADGQLEQIARGRSYATLAVARTSDRLLLGARGRP